jgi:hypothetical protein
LEQEVFSGSETYWHELMMLHCANHFCAILYTIGKNQDVNGIAASLAIDMHGEYVTFGKQAVMKIFI